ncbi:energy-coupling factor transporter transmembrane component T [Anaerovorax sp. IOR16]|uniref:energy-coupling factor transporter transmembrane component T n=1 Tax=Anaerovorax sp. IOR16 TaxID=2773458 RepID=UPI0019D1FB47|nr:energy-coupling factor transporter transmembrane component T [Anaerovorax sp. IOR16]
MNNNVFQAESIKRGLVLDPRTKLLLLVTMSVFVLSSAGGKGLEFLAPCLCIVPFVLLLTSKKFKSTILYAIIYLTAIMMLILLRPITNGVVNFLILGTAGIVTRFMPSIMVGMYVLSTTTVSEFNAAMLRLNVSEKIIIPLSVMFRFFPTVLDEFSSINAAMRMRGISLGGKNVTKMLEYRLVPLLTCSVKIGEELSAAALTRGLGGNVKRTNVCEIGFHLQDMVIIFLCFVPFALMLLSRCGIL